MKKFFSTLLILCMVLTSLSVGVNASYTAPTEDANYNTITFGGTKDIGYNVGEFRLSNGTDPAVTLGTIEYNDATKSMGMDFKKLVFEKGSLTAPANSLLSIRCNMSNPTYYGFSTTQTYTSEECFLASTMNTILGAVDTDDDGVIDKNSGNVVKYTVYAYSALPDGEPVYFDIVGDSKDYGADLMVPASKLYSKNGIPHKIDFIFYHKEGVTTPVSSGSKNGNYMEVWVDGLFYAEGIGEGFTINKPSSRIVFLTTKVDLTPDENGVVEWKDTELYIWTYKAQSSGKYKCLTDANAEAGGGKYLTVHTHDDINNHIFQPLRYGGGIYDYGREGFVTGVDSEFASDLEALYTTAINGDRVVEVDASVYNDPKLIWNDGATESSVSLVKIEDGTVYGVADKANVTGTFDDYLIAVNGVYTKVELAPVSYNEATKTATVSVSALPAGTTSMQIVVAAYNADGKMEKIKVSELYTDLTSNITYVIDDTTFPVDANKYKVFVFDSLTSAKPLAEALEK